MNEYWALENANDESQRKGQLEAIATFTAWLADGCFGLVFSIYMCCRYGKSDTIRNLALIAIARRKACAALVIHPYQTLAQQFLDESRLKSWRQRWLAIGPHDRISKVQTLHDFAKGSMCDGQWIGSIHIQALLQPMQKALLMAWVEKCKKDTGLPPIIFFDEAHQFSQANKWGDVARDLRDCGCLVVVLTATPFRNDGDDVFGFKKKAVGETKSREFKYVQQSANEPDKLELHKVSRDETEFLLEADVEVPFSHGWAEGCIAKCTFDLIDWNMEGWGENEGKARLLSELSQKEARSELPKLYRDPLAIREAVRRVIAHINAFRKKMPDATAIWYGMNDETKDDVASENQKAIRDAIKAESPNLNVAIATLGTNGDSEQKASDTILKFCDVKKKWYDILVLKQMGAAGLDSDRICVVVLWNSVRSLDKMIQMAMRGGNVATKTHFVIVGLKDPITVAKLQSFVDGEGGKYVDAIETDHVVDLIDKKDNPQSGYIAVDVFEAGMSDSDGNFASFDDVRLANHVVSMWPSLMIERTIPQIADDAKRIGIPLPADCEDVDFEDTTKNCDAYRNNLGEWVKAIGKRMFAAKHKRKSSGSKDDMVEYGQLYREAASMIKKRAGVFGSWDAASKDRSQKLSDYKKWTAAAEAIFCEVISEENS